MLDIKFVRDNQNLIRETLKKRRYEFDLDRLLRVDKARSDLIVEVDNLRSQKNQFAKDKDIEKGKKIKVHLTKQEAALAAVKEEFRDLLDQVPNLLDKSVPDGATEESNVEIKRWGEIEKRDFKIIDHVQIAEKLGIIDFEAGTKIGGRGFYYLKDGGALLELALVNWVMQFLVKKGFHPVITPELALQKFIQGTGYLPKREEPDLYKVENEDLYLIATAEIPLAGMHAEQILNEEDLPLNYAGFSSSFRKESGTYGKYAKGIYRVHQFDKVEIFKFAKPADSEKEFKEIIAVEEEIYQALKIPYRIVNIASGEMSAPAVLKYDFEYYSPLDETYRELTSTSNTTDYQARRLGIKYRTKDGKKTEFVHTLNGTAIAMSRTPIAILENYQQKDGSVKVPEVLREFLGKDTL
ncbi:MAG: serine--tRNA ligase [bacterium]|nr:serine--tRNA ligase [bacterium]